MQVEHKGMGMARNAVALWSTMSRWREGGVKSRQGYIPTVSGTIHMLRNYKHNFFGQGLLPVFSPEDREEGGGFYSVILKETKGM